MLAALAFLICISQTINANYIKYFLASKRDVQISEEEYNYQNAKKRLKIVNITNFEIDPSKLNFFHQSDQLYCLSLQTWDGKENFTIIASFPIQSTSIPDLLITVHFDIILLKA